MIFSSISVEKDLPCSLDYQVSLANVKWAIISNFGWGRDIFFIMLNYVHWLLKSQVRPAALQMFWVHCWEGSHVPCFPNLWINCSTLTSLSLGSNFVSYSRLININYFTSPLLSHLHCLGLKVLLWDLWGCIWMWLVKLNSPPNPARNKIG